MRQKLQFSTTSGEIELPFPCQVYLEDGFEEDCSGLYTPTGRDFLTESRRRRMKQWPRATRNAHLKCAPHIPLNNLRFKVSAAEESNPREVSSERLAIEKLEKNTTGNLPVSHTQDKMQSY
ncbi:hypothetical protein RUM43_009387 [Polyplax serrata]|uniref:Uncharacterized protein n=1 Tax=Polyplax serrata TaxID=468196 RepID=A0AAN8NVC6_POLSC